MVTNVKVFLVNNWSTIYSLQHGPYTLFSNCAWGCHPYWSTTLWLLLPYHLSLLVLHWCQLRTNCDQLGARWSNSMCQQLWGNLSVRLLIHLFVVDPFQLHWSEIKGVGYWIWGWLVRVVGFRTGVRNFVGAGLGFWESTFVFLDLGLLWGKFFGVLWLVILWYVWFQGVIISFSLVIPFIFVLFFGSVEPQGVCWNIWVVVSLATPQHKYVQTQTVLYARPVLYILYHLRCHSFDFRVLSLRGSIISNSLETLECSQNSQAPFQPQQGFLRVFSLDHPLLGSDIQSIPVYIILIYSLDHPLLDLSD